MRQLSYTPQFEKEIANFNNEVKEDVFLLVQRYLAGERLPKTQFKTFDVGKGRRSKSLRLKTELGIGG